MSYILKQKRFCYALVLFSGILVLFFTGLKTTHSENSDKKTNSTKVDFVAKIQPLIEKHCLSCHGNEEPESDFSLTSSQNLLKGGLSGKVIVPGKANESDLYKMIAHQHDDEIVMPPEDIGDPLSENEIALFKKWIDEGANWPKKITLGEKTKNEKTNLNHWSFQPIKNPPLPKTGLTRHVKNEIDYFILHRLKIENFKPSPEADKRTLIRRVTLDLIGLPPTPDEVEEFLQDKSANAYEKLVDRLLESPHYGERWARPWLDLCHYGDSDGYLTDALRPNAWRFRDWVVNALNANMPFDQFTIEQLAGDLLPGSTVSQTMATGFLRQTLNNREGGADVEEFRIAKVIDRTKIVGTSWLGLSLECCRCHNHKYDPISQEECYQFYSFFNNDYEFNVDAPSPEQKKKFEESFRTYVKEREKILSPVKEEVAALQEKWEKKLLYTAEHPEEDYKWTRAWELLGLTWGIKTGEGQDEGLEIIHRDPTQRTLRQKIDLTNYFLKSGDAIDDKKFKELGLSTILDKINKLKEKYITQVRAPAIGKTKNPKKAYVHLRGIHTSPGIEVNSNTPEFLPPLKSTGKPDRLEFAQWLVSPENPLTSRVVVNRIWQEFFGQGLVISSDDFGTQGDTPSHPELLDWLANRYIKNGWNTKAIHKLIVTSATYRQSSTIQPDIYKIDPSNRFLSRQSPLRLSAESVRDIALSASGLLSKKMKGPSVRPQQPESVVKEGFGTHTWKLSEGEDRYRRGLYTFILRTSPFAQSVIFDSPSPGNICTKRERSNTPLQALTLLNDPVFFEAAEALANRIMKQHPNDLQKQIHYAYQLCFSRNPTDEEFKNISALYSQQLTLAANELETVNKIESKPAEKEAGSKEKDTKETTKKKKTNDEKPKEKKPSEKKTIKVQTKEEKATTVICSVLLNLHEFITRQ